MLMTAQRNADACHKKSLQVCEDDIVSTEVLLAGMPAQTSLSRSVCVKGFVQ